jgi:hypothetical protein
MLKKTTVGNRVVLSGNPRPKKAAAPQFIGEQRCGERLSQSEPAPFARAKPLASKCRPNKTEKRTLTSSLVDTVASNSNRLGGRIGVRGFTQDTFAYQRIGPEAERLRRLGMSFRAIGDALGVDDKQVRKALQFRASCG